MGEGSVNAGGCGVEAHQDTKGGLERPSFVLCARVDRRIKYGDDLE